MATSEKYYDDYPFADDDLIDDYIEDEDFGPPPGFEDDFIEEMMAEEDQDQEQEPPKKNESNNHEDQLFAVNGSGAAKAINKSNRGGENNGLVLHDNEKEIDGDVIMRDSTQDANPVPFEVTVGQNINDSLLEGGKTTDFPLRQDKDSQLYSFERYVVV